MGLRRNVKTWPACYVWNWYDMISMGYGNHVALLIKRNPFLFQTPFKVGNIWTYNDKLKSYSHLSTGCPPISSAKPRILTSSRGKTEIKLHISFKSTSSRALLGIQEISARYVFTPAKFLSYFHFRYMSQI